MKKLTVQSLPIDEVIKDLAREFEIDYSCNCDEYYIDVPATHGEGFIHGIRFSNGIGLINYEVKFNEDTAIHFVKNHIHPVKCIFCYEGRVIHFFANDSKSVHEVDRYQNVIVASESRNGHILLFKKDELVKLNSVEVNREKFRETFSCSMASLPTDLHELFSGNKPNLQFYYIGQYSIEISDLIYRMHGFESNQFLRRIYIESKGLEMFALQMDQYVDDQFAVKKRSIFRKNEIEAIVQAAGYLKMNIKKYITVEELSQHIGLNENKLQAGFKYLYKNTINGFMQDFRLEEASRMLLNTDYNIAEISEAVGISSKGYFSKIFKEKFAVTPKAFQKKYGNG